LPRPKKLSSTAVEQNDVKGVLISPTEMATVFATYTAYRRRKKKQN
jgi:hypothetical protein